MRAKTILLLLMLLVVRQVLAVDVYSRKVNTTNGLPDNNVRNLAVDDKGFLWMGTQNGLYRFDGYFYTTYRHADEGNMRLLDNNHITGSYRLSDGRMLFAQQGNMKSVFDVRLNRFVDVPANEKERLYRQVRQHVADSLLLRPYREVLADGGNFINDNLGNVIVLDRTGRIWFIDRKTGETIPMKVYDEALFPLVSSQKYKVMTSEKKQLIWVSTNGCGITLYDRRTATEQHIRQSSGLISTDYIQDICLDAQDNLWVADEFHGVVYLSTSVHEVETHLLAPDSDELRANQVYLLRWLNDTLLMAANTRGDVYEADSRLNLRQVWQGIDAHAVCTDLEGRLWVGSRSQGLQSPDGLWHPHREGAVNSPSGQNVTALLCDADGHIWMGCEHAQLDYVEMAGDTLLFRHFLPREASPKTLLQDRRGTIWVGCPSGLYYFRPTELLANERAYQQRLSAKDTRQSDVNCLYEDAKGRLWVGTSGNGVYYSTDNGQSFKHISTSSGLISNEIQSIISDADGIVWIATRKGITCYNPDNNRYHFIYNEHSLLQNYYVDNSACRLPDGRLAFGTNQGIVVYAPSHHSLHTATGSTFRFTDFLINGVSVSLMGEENPLAASPDDLKEITLAHDQNSVTVRFSAFNFNTVAGTRYAWFLEGYDKSWSELSAYSFADYKNLPPGKYVLHVKAYDNNSSDIMERQLTIIVKSPWWKTWWAYLIYIVVAAIVGLLIVRQLRTVYKLRRRISIEQELTEFKLQFFTNISHEFRTPLTIIRGAMDRINAAPSIPADLRQPVSNMQKSTNRMLQLINQIMEFRKMQNNKLRLALEETDVIAFLKDIYLSFVDLAENKQIAYTFMPSVKSYMMYVDRQHLDKVTYNLLSNAFKYTPAKGQVMVRVSIGDGRLTLRVEDTGVGIPREKQPELFQRFMQSTFSSNSIGIGLHLSKALVDVHHGHIRFEENQPQGSVFIVELPTDKSVYRPEDFLEASDLQTGCEQPVAGSAYQELMPEPLNDRTVLVVEDDVDVADYVRQTLMRYFVVEVACDGAQALEKLASQRFDLVVSDVMMPVMDGYELTQRIKGDAALRAIPVVLLTSLTAESQKLKGVEKGADAYLTKPFDVKMLIATCRSLIEQRDRLRQSFAEQPAGKTIAPPEIIVDERDKHLLDVMNLWLTDHIANPMLSVDDLAAAMGYGRSVFFKKVKALTGQTPADYIRTLRMNRAADMLREETITVAEVAYKVGISDPHYFTKVFKQQFGVSPKKYQQGGVVEGKLKGMERELMGS